MVTKNLAPYWSGFCAGTLFAFFVLCRVLVLAGAVGPWLDAPGLVAGVVAWLVTEMDQ